MQIMALFLQQLSNGTHCHHILKTLQTLRTPQTHLYTQAFCN